jgi:excisionase family DNA binding protein
MSTKPERLAFNISEFCEAVGISRGFFYALPEHQKPRMVKFGSRYLIPVDAVKAWLGEGVAA